MKSVKITYVQFGFLLFSYLSGFSTLFLNEAKFLKQDVWISYTLGTTLAIIMMQLMCYIQKQYPNLKMVEIFDNLVGSKLAKLLICIYLLYILEIQTAACRALSFFYTTVVLPNLPSNQIMLFIILCTTYATFLGLGTIVRSTQVIMPFFLAGITIICLFIIRELETNPFLPQFQHSIRELVYGGWLSFYFPFGKSIVFIFILYRVKNLDKIFTISLSALVLSFLYLLLATYLTLGSLGLDLAGTIMFPFFSTIQMVKFGEYLERIEIVIIAIWTIFTLFEIVVLQHIFIKLFAHTLQLKNTRIVILPVGLLFFAMAQKSFIRMSDLYLYNTTIALVSSLLPTAIIPILLVFLTLVRKRKRI
ncbi:GerAB/ArcD/ProY family transporter [Paenibacillus qinlingensis]|uniref:GerAB/ArcD/ProY family transporter n=1 Tax=Paenibacillus qinlingensis TaxID=1837343 RepID=UPI0015644243|nr:GerAB/ArcD/ProY family transporter [Paenibacillus qinlingensis]NQX59846.1 GerAB/ArcD/ProY family transporter [Paenibacillus qinlingensis]